MRLKPLAGLVGMLLVSAPAYALTEVDTELQLLMDVSGSVSASEFVWRWYSPDSCPQKGVVIRLQTG
ncbi:hypothetical protein [Aeromonas dhakensis]|uniref:hypothetical protein n=1 Tax=Aeromonas dhakensis TaxID=196024 RepID=UPI003B9DC8FD